MANTITKNNSFGEVLDALKLKGVKACRNSWVDVYKVDDCYIYFDEEKYEITRVSRQGKDISETEFIVIGAEDLFTEDWIIIYPN